MAGDKRKRDALATEGTAGKGSRHAHFKKQKHASTKPSPKTKEVVAPVVKQAVVVANSNWQAMKMKIQQRDQKFSQSTEKKHDLDVKANKQRIKDTQLQKKREKKTAQLIDNSLIVAMDCEMVGVGLSGKQSVLARCSIVDYDGNVLYDKAVRPVEKVTDFRTHVSGIRSRTLRNAIPFAQCLKEVGKILKDKILVGHALSNDFKALMFTPPRTHIRDTAKYRPYMRRKMNGTKLYPKSLKHLAEEVLGIQIQTGEHDSVEDARATLALYKREQYAWEKYLRTSKLTGGLVGIAPALPKDSKSTTVQTSKAILASIGEDDEGTDSEDEFGSSITNPGGRIVVPDTKELAITEFAE